MNESSIWYLKGLGLQQRISAEKFEDLQRLGKIERWGHRAELTRGDGRVGLILGGSLDVQDSEHGGSSRLKAGDLFSMGEQSRSSDSIRAYDDATICSVNPDDFNALVGDRLGVFGIRVGLRDRKHITLPVVEFMYRPSEGRLARSLELLGERYGESQGAGVLVPFRLRARHLAALTGISPSGTRAVLEEFKSTGLVRPVRGGLWIPELDAIKKLSTRKEG